LPKLKVAEEAGKITVTGQDFALEFDRPSGTLKSWQASGRELIQSPLRPDFWRAPTDNDRGRNMAGAQGVWRKAHEDARVEALRVEAQSGSVVKVTSQMTLPRVKAEWETTYTIHASGAVVVTGHFKPGAGNLPKLPRLGMQMAMPAGFDRIQWLGPGPQETYCDRKDARMGVYSGSVDGQFYADYTEPGESGNKADARWVALTDGKGFGLLAVGLPLLSVNALPYTTDDLQNAKHAFELKHRDFVTVNFDLKQQGAGGDDSWGAWPHNEHLIDAADYTYQFRLRPLRKGDDPGKLARSAF
jgi:beta-galactosidase